VHFLEDALVHRSGRDASGKPPPELDEVCAGDRHHHAQTIW